jgi:hypothetical protein
MKHTPAPLSPEHWMLYLFSSRAAREGAVIRRKVRDIDRYVGRAKFEDELKRRGFQAFENAGQWVIFCNKEPIRPVLSPFSFEENDPEN